MCSIRKFNRKRRRFVWSVAFFFVPLQFGKDVTCTTLKVEPETNGGVSFFLAACQGSYLKRMEIDMKESRKPREVFDVAPTQPRGNESPKDSRRDGRFEGELERLLEKCKAAPDYLTAYFVFNSNTGTLRRFGCPEELIGEYDLRLARFFSRKNEVADAARNIIELMLLYY